jgi:hypothetical protein
MNINEQQIDAFVNAGELSEQKEYLGVIREKLHRILEQLNINKYEENIHYTLEGKTGKVNYFDVLKQIYNRPNNEIFLRDTEQYCLPGELLHTVYSERDVRGELIMQFGDNVNFENSVFNLTHGRDNTIGIN